MFLVLRSVMYLSEIYPPQANGGLFHVPCKLIDCTTGCSIFRLVLLFFKVGSSVFLFVLMHLIRRITCSNCVHLS
jgi:hypothetical protein